MGPAIVALAAMGEAIEARFASRADGEGAGGGIAGAGAGSAVPRRGEAVRLGLLAAALVVVSLVNPYGARLLRFPFRLMGSTFMGEIQEWRPPFDSAFAGSYVARYYVAWILIGSGVILGVLAGAHRRRAAPRGWAFGLLLFGSLLALSLRMNRAVSDFGLATFPALAGGLTWLARDRLGRLERSSVRRLVGLATITALLILGAVIALHGYPYRPGGVRPFGFGIIGNTPVAAADYLEANGVRGNVFNSYETGPYLIYRLYPAIRVAMDSRNDVYGENLYGEYELALRDREILGALLGRIDAAAVVLGWMGGTPPPAARLLRTVGSWRPVYFDDAAIVYMRSDGGWPGLVARDGYTILDPADYRPGGLRREDAGRALAEADRAVRSGRGSSIARVMRIDALMALGRRDEALLDEERLLATRPALASIYVLLGDLHLGLGDRDTAAARYRRALDLEPGWPRAAEGLEAAHP
jgi:hypothetical protein